MPHGVCYLWTPSVLWLNVISDGVIAIAYFIIPLLLVRAMHKNLLPFGGLFFMFSAFIIMCGLTHIMKIVTVWYPVYYLEGSIAAITAIISIFTATVFLYIIIKQKTPVTSLTLLKLRELTNKIVDLHPPDLKL